jgi:hypothetical protein
MVEVIAASVILMTTIILVFGTIAQTRLPVAESSRKLRAATCAQDVLDALRGRVNDSEWNNSSSLISVRLHSFSEISGLVPCAAQVNGTYNVSTDPRGFRKITANVIFENTL